MKLSPTLQNWIAQSESWQAFKDFSLPEDNRADYGFLKRWDDFYISLFSRAFDLLRKDHLNDDDKEDLLAIAQGLVIFSLEGKREQFTGISYNDNMLYAAALFYLADYPASALLLARKFELDSYSHPIDGFIASFLARVSIPENPYSFILTKYLKSGHIRPIVALSRRLDNNVKTSLDNDYQTYSSAVLANALIKKFRGDNIWRDLKSQVPDREFWLQYVNYSLSHNVPVWSFFPSQKKALNNNILGNSTSSLQMPTSAGKTAISELVIYNSWKKNRSHRFLYLAPYRSLAAELSHGMGRNLKTIGISVKSIYGGHLPTPDEQDAIETVNLLISTPEKMLAVEDAIPDILERFDTIICDEGHLLDDETRGLNYELLLSRLKNIRGESKKFLFISAIIPNIESINSWLGGSNDSVVTSDYRPTELEYAFLDKRGSNYDLIVNPLSAQPRNYILYKYLTKDSLTYEGPAGMVTQGSKRAISVATALRAIPSGGVALFTTERRGNRGVEGLAEEVLHQATRHINANNPANYSNQEVLGSIHDYFKTIFGEEYLLTRLIKAGTLFHHGDLPQDVREVIEEAVRQADVKLIICNTTLAEGVNLPIKTIVLHSLFRFDGPSKPHKSLKLRELKNLVGRAGRAGKETKGLVVVPHEKERSIVESLIREQPVERVDGMLYTLINRITETFRDNIDQLSNELLEGQDEWFLQLLDSIDESLIDLLAEDVEVDSLDEIVREMISHTMSYYQASEEERYTLDRLFLLRAERLRGYIENSTFGELSRSGSSLRGYESINDHFDFEDEFWTTSYFSPTDDDLISYLLENGVFKLESFKVSLEEFNKYNHTELDIDDVKLAIELWMLGEWYETICAALDLETYQTIRLITRFLGFELQGLVSSVIRIKIAKDDNYEVPTLIFNWPLYLQYGISDKTQLALFELGLTDRVAVLHLAADIEERNILFTDEEDFRDYLLANEGNILGLMKDAIPLISYNKLNSFINSLKM